MTLTELAVAGPEQRVRRAAPSRLVDTGTVASSTGRPAGSFAPPGDPGDGWTVADLERLPEDGYRYEIIDGSLVMSPSPTVFHQRLIRWLVSALLVDMPIGFDVVENVGVLLGSEPTRLLVPDACAVRSTKTILEEDRVALSPDDVLLAVEVVSRSSVSMDRTLKPALYAQAGIPSFWRVEGDAHGIAVHAFGIEVREGRESGEYEEVCVVRSGETATLDAPWPVTLTPPS